MIIQDIHRCRVDLPGFTPANLQKIIVLETQAETDDASIEAINEPLDQIGPEEIVWLVQLSPLKLNCRAHKKSGATTRSALLIA